MEVFFTLPLLILCETLLREPCGVMGLTKLQEIVAKVILVVDCLYRAFLFCGSSDDDHFVRNNGPNAWAHVRFQLFPKSQKPILVEAHM